MAKVIVSTGRGGTGKSTFVAIATKYLPPPLLLFDIDPDMSLGAMLGVDLEAGAVSTIAEELYDIQTSKEFGTMSTVTLPDKISYMLEVNCRYESERFDLISLGAKWTEGCYCAPDDLLKAAIPRLAKNYATVVVDSPAGLEHLNRKIISDIDDMFVISDASSKAIGHIQRVKKIAEQIKVMYGRLFVVGNYEFDSEMEELIRQTGETYLGKIDFDASVKEFNMKGKPLLKLPDDSPACVSVRRVLTEAGYSIEGVRSG